MRRRPPVNDKKRTIRESAIPEVLAGALGAAIGGVGSFAALYGLGSVVGLSAAGITSGLAAAGGIVGGGMVAGIFVLAAPVAVLGGVGVGVASHLKNRQLRQEKERLYKEALSKHDSIIKALKEEAVQTKNDKLFAKPKHPTSKSNNGFAERFRNSIITEVCRWNRRTKN